MAPRIFNRQQCAIMAARAGVRRNGRRRAGGWLVHALLYLAALPMLLMPVVLVAAPKISVEMLGEGVDPGVAPNVTSHVNRLGITSGAEARRLRVLIEKNAHTAMEAFGHYEARIEVDIAGDNGKASISLRITPGEPVRWHDTAVRLSGPGAQDPLFLDVLVKHSPQPGTPLRHDQYDSLKKQLHNTALAHGYFDGEFQQQRLLIDRANHRADVDLAFDTGVRYRLGEVTFGPSQLGRKQLRRQVPFRPGDPYDESEITRLNRNLLDSGYFQSVSLQPQRPKAGAGEEAIVPVKVELQDAKDNRVSAGLGYGTDTGPRVKLGWVKPLLNSAGHSLNLSTSLSEPKKEAVAQYKIPDGEPGYDFWLLQVGYQEENFEDSEYELFSYGASRQQRVFGDWQRTYFANVKHERGFQDGEFTEDRPSDSFYIAPGISFSHTRSEGGLHPRSGHRFSTDLEFSDPWIGSDTEYVRLQVLAKYLFSLSQRQQLLLRGQAGMIWSDQFSQVPVSVRFYAGGDQSIRGYDYNSLSPLDENDNLVGGSRLLVGGADYLYEFRHNWLAALFVDHGGALDETNEPLFSGAGFGVRWLSPVGSLSLDLAQALNGEDEGDYRLHFTMGTVL